MNPHRVPGLWHTSLERRMLGDFQGQMKMKRSIKLASCRFRKPGFLLSHDTRRLKTSWCLPLFADVRAVICSDWSISVTLGSAGLSVTEGNCRRSLTSAPFKLKFWPHFLWRLHTWTRDQEVFPSFLISLFLRPLTNRRTPPFLKSIYWSFCLPDLWRHLIGCWRRLTLPVTFTCLSVGMNVDDGLQRRLPVSAVAVRLFIEFCSLLFSIFFSWLKHLFIVLMKTNKDALFTFVHHVLTWTTFDLLCAENQLISEIWFTGKYVLVPKVPTEELEH